MIRPGENKRIFLYAGVLSLCFYLVTSVDTIQSFFITLSISGVVLLIALLSIWKISSEKLAQLDLPSVNVYSKSVNIIYHFVLPLVLFVDFAIFIYINSYEILIPFLLILIFTSFTLVLINLRAYLEDKFKLELATHFIYTFIVIFTLFSCLIGIYNIINLHDIPVVAGGIVVMILSFILTMVLFNQFVLLNYRSIIFYGIASVLMGATSIILYTEFESILRNAFLTSILFYLMLALSHHKQEGSLNFNIIIEYIIITALGFVLLYGIA